MINNSTKPVTHVQRKANRLLLPSLQRISSSNNQYRNLVTNTDNHNTSSSTTTKEKEFQNRTNELLSEAKSISLSFYRTCQRCVNLMRPGNTNDEKEFQRREEAQKSTQVSINGFQPAVNRNNELSSRANYYHDFIKENFVQESDCLNYYPLLEQHVQKYLYLLRKGDEGRQWILNDYKFNDPYANAFNADILNNWEDKAEELIKDVYTEKGWMLEKDLVSLNNNTVRNNDDDDDDDDEFLASLLNEDKKRKT